MNGNVVDQQVGLNKNSNIPVQKKLVDPVMKYSMRIISRKIHYLFIHN